MELTEIAWAAGLFEGEGSISSDGQPPRLQIKMTSEASVRRFGDAIDGGLVYGPYGPYPSQLGRTPYFMWVAQGGNARQAATVLAAFVSEPWRTRLMQMSEETR